MTSNTHIRTFATVALIAYLALPQALFAAVPAVTASDVLLFTNAQRYRAGLSTLTPNSLLTKVAFLRMQDLFARQYFAHETPTGETVADVAKSVGYTYITVGENLALGDFYSNKQVVDAWMNSPGHRANILSDKYSEIGIAAGQSMYKGKMAWIIVQVFGLPRSSCPAIDSAIKIKIDSLEERLSFLKPLIDLRRQRAEESNLSRTEYNRRVDEYNAAAAIYNAIVKEQKALVASYNSEVGSFNSCLTKKVGVEVTTAPHTSS